MILGNYLKLFFDARTQILCTVFATLNSLSDGMQLSWSAPSSILLLKDDDIFSIEQADIVWLEMMVLIFSIMALPVIIYLEPIIGRKRLTILASFIGLIAWILIGLGNTREVLFVARSMAGAAVSVSFVSSPIYVAEIANKNIRGFLVGIPLVAVHLGIILMYSIGSRTSLRIPPIIAISVLIVQLLTLPWFPESPYYFISKNNEEAARKSLTFFQRDKDLNEKLKPIKEDVEQQRNEGGWKNLFITKSHRKVIFIITILSCAQPASGYIAILMNLNIIMESAGADSISPDVVTQIFAFLMLAGTISSILLVDKIGRKILITLSCFITALSLFFVGAFFHVKDLKSDLSQFFWIPVVFINFYAMFFKLGLGTISITLFAEICPPDIKTVCMAYADLLYNSTSCLSLYLFHYLVQNFGFFLVFYMYSITSMLIMVITLFYVPETKGKTFQEIQTMLKK